MEARLGPMWSDFLRYIFSYSTLKRNNNFLKISKGRCYVMSFRKWSDAISSAAIMTLRKVENKKTNKATECKSQEVCESGLFT